MWTNFANGHAACPATLAATQLSEQLAQLRMALADTHDVVVARTAELKVRQV